MTITVTRISTLTGNTGTMELPISEQKYNDYMAGKLPGLIQEIFPECTPDEREFILTGTTPADWDDFFSEDEDGNIKADANMLAAASWSRTKAASPYVEWRMLDPNWGIDTLGFIPTFFLKSDSRLAREQINDRYAHGGGWMPLPGIHYNPSNNHIKLSSGEDLIPKASAKLPCGECLFFYDHEMLCVVDGEDNAAIMRVS